ncbi:MAG: LysM peptidoglycan-binding domain-containing protein, partial [Ruminococcaceae bacterium]|nr:LysM peptidoglycan-binding domain-containing protein [Oscillospiraceae bacterium]
MRHILMMMQIMIAYARKGDVMQIYTVNSGDSIYSIARKFGTTPSRIVTDNELTDPGRLAVGQSLVILEPTRTYTVRGGDTLDGIARLFGVSLTELWRNNPILGG